MNAIFRIIEAQQKITLLGRVVIKLISSILDILSKVPLGYLNENVMNHKLRKGNLKLGEGKGGGVTHYPG